MLFTLIVLLAIICSLAAVGLHSILTTKFDVDEEQSIILSILINYLFGVMFVVLMVNTINV